MRGCYGISGMQYQICIDEYNRCGKADLVSCHIPWFMHNFGGVDVFENSRAIARRAFDLYYSF